MTPQPTKDDCDKISRNFITQHPFLRDANGSGYVKLPLTVSLSSYAFIVICCLGILVSSNQNLIWNIDRRKGGLQFSSQPKELNIVLEEVEQNI